MKNSFEVKKNHVEKFEKIFSLVFGAKTFLAKILETDHDDLQRSTRLNSSDVELMFFLVSKTFFPFERRKINGKNPFVLALFSSRNFQFFKWLKTKKHRFECFQLDVR